MGIVLGFGRQLTTSRVLLVDDDPLMRRLIESHVRTLGCDVVTAKNGEEAVRMVPEVKPDLVIMDVVMPGMDGFEACEWMKKLPAMKGVPVVLLTALGRDAKERSFAAGADSYLRKPPSVTELQAKLSTFLLIRSVEQQLGGDAPIDEPLSKDSPYKPEVWLASTNSSLRLRLTSQLEREGCRARSFEGLSAISHAMESDSELPDLLILDHDPNDGDAVRVSRSLRESEATARLPILMLVSDGDLKAEFNDAPCGASEFLSRNPDAADVRQRIRILLRLSALNGALHAHQMKG